jgi:hypothetical protein
MYTQPVNHTSRRSFLTGVGGLGSLALAPWSRAVGAESRVTDLLIFLPGITGSVLQHNKKDVWALTTESIGGALTSLGQNLEALELKDDPQDVEDLGDGVVATGLFPDVHLIPGFSKIDGYSGVRAALSQRLKLDGAQNYIEFPYDWRRDNRVSARKLARLVPAWLDQWKKASGNADAKVVFIAHSMGGLVARYYLECLEGWRYARKLITFGTPYRGSVNALDFLSNGYAKTFAGFNVADLSALMRSFTSVYQLLPRYPCVEMDGVMRRPGEVSGLPNIDPAKAATGLAFHRELEQAICANAGSKEYKAYALHPIVGIDQPTKQSARIRAGRLEPFNQLNGTDGSGDGTVPRLSAFPLGCTREDDEAFGRAAFYVSGIHGSLQNLPQVVTQVSYVLLEPKFEGFRPASEAFSLGVDDAYLVGEPIRIRCDAGTMACEGLLIVEEAATGQQVFKRNLVPQSNEPVSVGALPAGTYRAALEAGGRRLISDVFLVSR